MAVREPWSRMPGESAAAYAMFRRWLDAGRARRVSTVAKECKRSPSLLYRWSSQWRWADRAEQYDREQDQLHADAMAVARREHALRHIAIGDVFLNKIVDRLREIDPSKLSPRDMATWLDVAVKVQRLALGEPERHELSGPDSAPIDIDVSGHTEADVLADLRVLAESLFFQLVPMPGSWRDEDGTTEAPSGVAASTTRGGPPWP